MNMSTTKPPRTVKTTLGGKFLKPISFRLILLRNHHVHAMLVGNATAVAIKNSLLILAEQPIVVVHKQLSRVPIACRKLAFFPLFLLLGEGSVR